MSEEQELVKEVTKTIDETRGIADRPIYGTEQRLIDEHSVVTYLHNYLYVDAVPLKPGQVGNLWGVGGVNAAAEAIMAHMDRRAKILREKGESAI